MIWWDSLSSLHIHKLWKVVESSGFMVVDGTGKETIEEWHVSSVYEKCSNLLKWQ